MINTSKLRIYICVQLELIPDAWLASVVSRVVRRTRFADRTALMNQNQYAPGDIVPIEQAPYDVAVMGNAPMR